MLIRPSGPKLGSVRRYVPTDKVVSLAARDKEQTHARFADMIREKFGSEGATPEDIYQELTGPLGLTAETTLELLYATKSDGYLTTSQKKGSEERL